MSVWLALLCIEHTQWIGSKVILLLNAVVWMKWNHYPCVVLQSSLSCQALCDMNSRHAVHSQRAFQTAKKLVHLHPGTDALLLIFILSVHIYIPKSCCYTGWPQTWNTQGFLWTWKTRGILREFCATSGKNCSKQSIFSSSFKYLVRVWWWPVMLLELMWNDPWWRSLLHLLVVAITYWKVSLWLWKSLENSGNFFLLHCSHPVIV